MPRLHPVKELADISLCHEQRVRQPLLCHPLRGADLRQNVELSNGEIELFEVFGGFAIDELEGSRKSKPAQQTQPAYSTPNIIHCLFSHQFAFERHERLLCLGLNMIVE